MTCMAFLVAASRCSSCCARVGAATCALRVYLTFVCSQHGCVCVQGVCDTLAAGGYHVVMPDVYGKRIQHCPTLHSCHPNRSLSTNVLVAAGDELGVNDKGGFKSKEGVAFIKSFDWDNLKPKLEET